MDSVMLIINPWVIEVHIDHHPKAYFDKYLGDNEMENAENIKGSVVQWLTLPRFI
jgi:hypothetical protein